MLPVTVLVVQDASGRPFGAPLHPSGECFPWSRSDFRASERSCRSWRPRPRSVWPRSPACRARPGRRRPPPPGRATSTPAAAPPARPPTAPCARCTTATSARCTRSRGPRTTRRSRSGRPGPGGYADAAAQTAFCAGTTCTISRIYDQSGHDNTLGIEPIGGNGSPDVGAIANALPVTIDGHLVVRGLGPGRGRLPQRRHQRRPDRQPAAGRLHGDQRHPRRRPVLLRLRQRRDDQHRHRQRAHGRDQLRHRVLVRALRRVGPLGAGGPGERPVHGRQRLRHRQRRQREHVRDRDA